MVAASDSKFEKLLDIKLDSKLNFSSYIHDRS